MDISPLNQAVNIWRFCALNHRAARRAAMAADPDWSKYGEQASPLIQHMENKILTAAPHFELSALGYQPSS